MANGFDPTVGVMSRYFRSYGPVGLFMFALVGYLMRYYMVASLALGTFGNTRNAGVSPALPVRTGISGMSVPRLAIGETAPWLSSLIADPLNIAICGQASFPANDEIMI